MSKSPSSQTFLEKETTQSKAERPKKILFWRIVLLSTFAMLLALYALGAPVVSRGAYYQLLFLGRPYPAGFYDYTTVNGVPAEEVYFNVGKERLHGWFFRNKDAKLVALMHHGNGGNISILQWYVDLFLRAGTSFFVYDYEGYGKSTGTPSIEAVCRDSEAAYQFLTKRMHVKEKSVINFGLSLGTAPATQTAAKHPGGAGLILIAPYTSIRKTCKNVFQFLSMYPDQLWPEHDMGSLPAIKNVSCPTLIFHGQFDEMIPISDSEELKANSISPTEFVQMKCGHGNLGEVREEMLQKIQDFVQKAQSPEKKS